MVFVPPCLAYFTSHNALQFLPCCCKGYKLLLPLCCIGLYPKNPETPIQKYLCTQCSQQHNLQQPSTGSNLSAHQQMSGSKNQGIFTQWNSMQQRERKSFVYFLIGLFVFLVLSHMSSLYILEIKLLSEVSLANMFSHRVGSLFILMMVSLAVQQLFNLMQPYLFIFFPCISLALEDILAKILLCGISEILLPMFAARTFMASQLIFKFFIYFEFILVYGVRWSFSFTFLHVSSTSPNTTY